MKHYEHNPRQITKAQFERLKETMADFGDLSGIVHNLETDEIIGGNQRSEAAELLNKEPVITERFDPPQEDGTVALGYFNYKGRRFQYRAVRWDADKAMRANLIANVGGGSWDWDALSSFPAEMLINSGFDLELLSTTNNDANNIRQLFQSENEIDTQELWQGMPEFNAGDPKAYRSLKIHFQTKDDYDKFIQWITDEIEQSITDKTKSIWYPKSPESQKGLIFEHES